MAIAYIACFYNEKNSSEYFFVQFILFVYFWIFFSNFDSATKIYSLISWAFINEYWWLDRQIYIYHSLKIMYLHFYIT